MIQDANVLVGPTKERLDIKVALSNSFGFGGHNSSILFAPYKQILLCLYRDENDAAEVHVSQDFTRRKALKTTVKALATRLHFISVICEVHSLVISISFEVVRSCDVYSCQRRATLLSGPGERFRSIHWQMQRLSFVELYFIFSVVTLLLRGSSSYPLHCFLCQNGIQCS